MATVGNADVQGDTEAFSRENRFNQPSTFSLPGADRHWSLVYRVVLRLSHGFYYVVHGCVTIPFGMFSRAGFVTVRAATIEADSHTAKIRALSREWEGMDGDARRPFMDQVFDSRLRFRGAANFFVRMGLLPTMCKPHSHTSRPTIMRSIGSL